MKAVLSFVAAGFLAAVLLWQLAHRGVERGMPVPPPEPLASSPEGSVRGEERPTPIRRETNAASASITNKLTPASLAALPAAEQRSLEEQIRAAQNWFAYAGNMSNGSPRLVASVRGQKFDFNAEDSGVSVRPWSGATNWSWRMTPVDGVNVAPKAEKTRADRKSVV